MHPRCRLDDPKLLTRNTRVVVKALASQLDGEYLVVLSNPDGAAWHIVRPGFAGERPVLRRMVIERGLPRRTVVTQLAKIYSEAARVGHVVHADYSSGV